MSRKWFKRHLVDKLSNMARVRGLFVLPHLNRIEFLSATTGKLVLTWWKRGGGWNSVNDRWTRCPSSFTALDAAMRIDRQQPV